MNAVHCPVRIRIDGQLAAPTTPPIWSLGNWLLAMAWARGASDTRSAKRSIRMHGGNSSVVRRRVSALPASPRSG